MKVVVNVDDFALAPAIDAGVCDLAQRGVVTSTSALVRGPRWPHAARTLSDLPLDVGLHLDLTADAHDEARASARFVLAAMMRAVPRARVRARIYEQFSRFEDALGQAPVFVDGHLHLHQLPGVRELLVEEIVRRYPTRKPALRVCWAAARSGVKARVIAALGAHALARLAAAAGIATNRAFAGVYDFAAPVDLAALWRAWLAPAVGDGLVVMSHVAHGGADGVSHVDAREREYAWLASPAFTALLRETGRTPVRWAELLAA